jgi:hypothetical protein
MSRWPKPPEGSWTEHYPELGTEPVECWGQARIPDSGAAALECLVEPAP